MARSGTGRGLLYGVIAYGTWGLAPLYWQLLKPAMPLEILAHRMTWSLVFLAIVNQLRRNWGEIRKVLQTPRLLRLLTAAALLGSEMCIRDRPWIGLILGVTFSAYGMVKKVADVDGVESLTIETLLLLPFSALYLIYLEFNGTAAFGHVSWNQTFWSLMAGVMTAVPLLAFGAAAVRIPYSTMGILQYMSPTIQFLIGFTVLHETMTSGRWIGFAIVWCGLAIFSIDALRAGRNFAQSDE